ncbi:MAG: sulfur carrier protein ThiS [Limnobacter sp.]|nr:sulfur carrier protein ThiS [Limnobacter sp.]
MISVRLNGKPTALQAGCTLADLLASQGLLNKRVAVELNGEIVPKSLHAQTPIPPDSQLEIVVAVGGG